MDAEAWKRGDPSAVRTAALTLAPELWCLARRGFLTVDESPVAVLGMDDPDAVERIVVELIAELCRPAERAKLETAAALRSEALRRARVRLLAEARGRGRATAVDDPPPPLDDLDAILRGEASLAPEDPPPDVEVEQRAVEELAVTRAYLRSLDAKNAKLVSLRWMQGKTDLEVAAALDCGATAVREWVRRVRRELHHRLRQSGVRAQRGAAAQDALLAGTPLDCAAPHITITRVAERVRTRTFQAEPPPFATRALWAAGAAAIAAGLWFATFVGLLPSRDDDPLPPPSISVDCGGPCRPKGTARIRVRSPKGAKSVAIVRAGIRVERVLVDPAGGSIGLPFGARRAEVLIPYPATLPSESGPVLAIFATRDLDAGEVERAAYEPPPRVVIASTHVELAAGP